VIKIAIIENGFVRDAQIYIGSPDDIDVDPDWEDNFVDVKNPSQFIGVFEGETDDEILKKASEYEGVHDGIITLIDIDGGVVHG
jgi:hypothetical protein